MKLTDTHCHLDIVEFRAGFSDILIRARESGVQRFVVPGVVQAGWERMFVLAAEEPGIFAAPGLHPMYLAYHQPEDLVMLRKSVYNRKVVALGEIGLDYFVKVLDKNVQQELLEAQLDLATEAQLPVLLHIRKAHDQVLATLRRKKFKHGGIVHAFSGSLQQAEHFIRLGFGIGISGTITYDRALKTRKNAALLPQEWLVLETDAPDIIVAQHRDQELNLPEYLPCVLETLAQLRNEEQTAVASYTTANADRILGLN